ncbi:hypothetical protein T484DRAFT_1963068 [Baffinella frigidus]|nr:hypothetical protein T484DRAFT_1963068 [Cryptophyta sp. CCMP2293]
MECPTERPVPMRQQAYPRRPRPEPMGPPREGMGPPRNRRGPPRVPTTGPPRGPTGPPRDETDPPLEGIGPPRPVRMECPMERPVPMRQQEATPGRLVHAHREAGGSVRAYSPLERYLATPACRGRALGVDTESRHGSTLATRHLRQQVATPGLDMKAGGNVTLATCSSGE